MAGPAATIAIQALRDRRLRRVVAAAVLAGASGLLLLLLVLTSVIGGVAGSPAGAEARAGASSEAIADIPTDLLALYMEAGDQHGVDWTVLAGIGKVECDHGRSRLAGCNPPGTINRDPPRRICARTWP